MHDVVICAIRTNGFVTFYFEITDSKSGIPAGFFSLFRADKRKTSGRFLTSLLEIVPMAVVALWRK